jgi:flagellar motor switch protein FliG
MFGKPRVTFEGITRLDDETVRAGLRKCSSDWLRHALKNAPAGVREKLFTNLQEQAARILAETIAEMGEVSKVEEWAAREQIVEIMRDAAGTIRNFVLGGAV